MAPCLFVSIKGSPMESFFVRSMNSVLNFSYTDDSINILLPHKQICPWLLKEDCKVVDIIFSQSQSAKIIFGFFPPSSRESFLNMGAAIDAMRSPALVLPVNEMAFTCGC